MRGKWIVFFLINSIFSQVAVLGQEYTQIELVEANTMEFDSKIGDKARRLLGSVVFKHEETWMFCDSAYLYPEINSLKAYSNVYIVDKDTLQIWGDVLYYDGNTRLAAMSGGVLMKDPQLTLTTDTLIYDLGLNTANYLEGGRIIDSENELTSLWGFYYADFHEFFFKDDVVLTNPDYVMRSDTLKYNTETEVAYFYGPTSIIGEKDRIYCKNGWYDTKNDIAQFNKDAYLTNHEQSLTGDSVYYDRNIGYGKAIQNVVLTDSVNQTFITGHFAEHFDQEGLSYVTDNAVLTIIYENDSLFLHADTLKSIYHEESDSRTLLAFRKAKFYRSDLQGLSDSIAYHTADSTIYMYYEPIIWAEENQMTAARIEIKSDGESVKSVHLFESSFSISMLDSLSFDQIKGRNMVGHFLEGVLKRIEVFGNGETIYNLTDEGSKKVNAINKAICSDIVIYIEDNAVSRIKFIDRPDATLYPPKELPQEERFLKNFKWHADRRPQSKQDIFTW